MAHRSVLRNLISGFLIVMVIGWLWKVMAAELSKSSKSQVVASESLGGSERYLTFVTTDKPVYRTGEQIYVRAVVLHHLTRRPLSDNQSAMPLIEIVGPKGETVASGQQQTIDSVAGFQWQVPESQPGGEYTVKVTHPWQGYAPAERKFDIRAYRAPRLKSQIKFLRDGYGPGDEVVGTLHVERAEGGIPVGAKVTVTGRVDGVEIARNVTSVDSQGNATGRFRLPAEIKRGEGTLAMIVEDGGTVETASKTIPILLQTVDLTLFPEGGEIVAGLPNRVYFEAFTPAKKPADLAGEIVDRNNTVVAKFRSEHEGRGRFEFKPVANSNYTLRITEPSGIKSTFALPPVQASGAVLQTAQHVFSRGEPIVLNVGSSKPFSVTLAKRETEAGKVIVAQPKEGLNEVSFSPPDWADGVLVATVWDTSGHPLAERLIYRQPTKALTVTIVADKQRYTPGGKAGVKIVTKNEAGEPVSAVVGLSIVDDSVLEMIEKREQRPLLPVQVLLEGEVKELADAQIYLDPQHEKSAIAVDLLLGTQGWRRFAFVKTTDFLSQHGDSAKRVVALLQPRVPFPQEFGFARGGAPQAVPERVLAIPIDAVKSVPAPLKLAEEKQDGDRPQSEPKNDDKKLANKEAERDQERLADGRRELNAQPEPAAAPAIGLAKARANDALRAELAELEARNDFVAIRVYAHELRSNRQPNERTDFSETLFWAAGVKTNDQGEAEVGFALNDSVTSFRVYAEAFGAAGGLGEAEAKIESVEPFYLEPKLPLEITSGDVVRLPIVAVNATDAQLNGVKLTLNTNVSQITHDKIADIVLKAGQRIRSLPTLETGAFNGPVNITVTASAGLYSDKVTRRMMVRPQGFPIEYGRGGLLGPGATATHEIEIPADMIPGSLETKILVYPTPLASMTAALERLIQEPCGCFEQTSSSTYPLVMAQQYFMSHQGVDPLVIERAARTLETGYQRLVGFECKSGGFEWFGQDPGHDALTAYGLMEFTDMAKVRFVDPNMLNRTRTWLLAQRDGKGTFARKTHTLHTWLPQPDIATAYNLWALLEAEIDADLSTEVKWVRGAGEQSQNTYVMALAANVLSLAGDKEGEMQLLDKLAGKQTESGNLQGATVSVIGSTGEALEIETTALATLAWLRNPSFTPQVEKSIKYLAEHCKSGAYGSTQSTILALKAIVAYDSARATPKAPGTLQLLVDNQPVGQPVAFTTTDRGAIQLPDLSTLSVGKHTVAIRMQDGSQMPFSISAKYHRIKPDSSEDCQVHLQVALRDHTLNEGAVTEAAVSIVNRKGETIPTPIAIIGIPGGLEVRHDQLKELVKANKIAAYEVIGREVVLYWRALAPEARVDLPISLVAAIPGNYTGPASRAYLYYTNEHKHWVDGMAVTINPEGATQ